MPRRCTVCLHPERMEVDKSLVTDQTYRSIAARFGLSKSALVRHKKAHLPARLAEALHPTVVEDQELVDYRKKLDTEDTRQAIDTVAQLKAINAACLEILKEARSDKKHVLSLRAVDRIARQIELQAKLLGEIQNGATVNIAVLPEWHGIRNAVLEALRPFPEARLAVGRALGSAGV